MSLEIWKKNLQALEIFHPQLSQQLSLVSSKGAYSAPLSKSGVPTLVFHSPSGNLKYLTSSYDPLKEARRSIDSYSDSKITCYTFYGMSLGHTLLELIQRSDSNVRAFVFERDPELMRLAMETFDFESAIKNQAIRFYLNVRPEQLAEVLNEDELSSLVMNGCQKIKTQTTDDEHSQYYAELESTLNVLMQRKSIDMKTRSGYSKRFFRNIVSNWPHILSSPGIDSLKKAYVGKTGIVVSAGPSLDKNLALLKNAQERALILVVGTALKPLLKRGIEPDFIFAVDPAPTAFSCFHGVVIPKKSQLVFDPGTCPQIVHGFSGPKLSFDSNLELSRWLASINEPKGFLGDMFSVAHTAFFFAHFLGCDPVLLVGQDLCFQKHRLHCSSSHYNTLHTDSITASETISEKEQRSFGKFDTSVLKTLNIFGKKAVTLNNLEAYKNQFCRNPEISKKSFNASEGGIPIPGIPNHPLRELLFLQYQNPLEEGIVESVFSEQVKPPKDLKSRMLRLVDKMEPMKRQLHGIQAQYISSEEGRGQNKRAEFVQKMESFYGELLEDSVSMRLLQEYAYASFVEWKRATGCLASDLNADELIESKFQRDKKFLPDLLSAMEYLAGAVRTMADQVPG